MAYILNTALRYFNKLSIKQLAVPKVSLVPILFQFFLISLKIRTTVICPYLDYFNIYPIRYVFCKILKRDEIEKSGKILLIYYIISITLSTEAARSSIHQDKDALDSKVFPTRVTPGKPLKKRIPMY